MDSIAPDTAENVSRSRRALLGGLLATGATVAFAGRANAADSSTDTTMAPDTTDAPMAMMSRSDVVTTTTAPPARSAADKDAINAAIAREADMVATYAAAAAAVSADDLAAVELIKSHHTAYVQAFAGYLGRESVVPAGTAASIPLTNFAAAAPALAALESQTVEAHIQTLRTVQGLDAANLIASVITVEARHQAALVVAASGDIQSVAK